MIAYLAEPSAISNSGKIKGGTLRCYEVILTEVPYKYSSSGTRMEPKPTGYVYILKENKLIKQKTTANLLNKWIPINHEQICTTIDKHIAYGSSYYATPELAILAKLNSIQKDYYVKQRKLKEALQRIEKVEPYIKQFHDLANQHPELVL